MSSRLVRYRAAVFGGALFISVALVFAWRHQSAVTVSNDPYKFADLGRNIAEGHGFCFTGGAPTIRRAPLYPFAIAILDFCFGPNPIAIQLFQCLLFAGTTLLVFEIGRRIASARTGLIAAVIAALHPMVFRYVPDVQVETLLTFLYTLTVYRTVRLIEEDSLRNGLLVGASAAAAALVKGVALPYPALFAAAYLFWRWRTKGSSPSRLPGYKAIVAMVLAMAVVILPWTYRNYRATGGGFVLISGNASGEFLRGYVFAQPKYFLLQETAYSAGENEANAMQEELYDRRGVPWHIIDQGLVQVVDEAQAEREQNLELREKVRQHPAALLKKFGIGLFMFWYVVTSRTNSLVVGALALAAWVFAIVGLVRNRGSGRHSWVLLIPIVSLNATYAAVLALGRYSAPCIPALVVLAAWGIDSLLMRSGAGRVDEART